MGYDPLLNYSGNQQEGGGGGQQGVWDPKLGAWRLGGGWDAVDNGVQDPKTGAYNPAGGATGSTGAMGGPPGGPTTTAISAQTSPALDALQGRYGKYLDNLEGNSGRIMDIAASKIRDTREGGRAGLQQSEGFRGVSGSNRLAGYDAATQRGQAGAIADITTQREGTLGNALQGGLGIARAPADLALQEKGFGLQAASQQLAQQQQTFNQLQALLQATRTSPLNQSASFYTGY